MSFRVACLAVATLGLGLIVACTVPEKTAGAGCPRLSGWSIEDQRALRAERAAAGPGSMIVRVSDELEYMRDQARACAGLAVPK